MLTQRQAQIDAGNVGWDDRRREIEFSARLELYAELLDERGVKEETKRSYEKTLAIAKDAFGHVARVSRPRCRSTPIGTPCRGSERA